MPAPVKRRPPPPPRNKPVPRKVIIPARGKDKHGPKARPPVHPVIALPASAADDYQRYYVQEGEALGASPLAILAALEAGAGENAWSNGGCNGSNHCGLWQIGSSWQAMHTVTDWQYWTRYAYQHGFWGHGGLISLAQQNPRAAPGYLTNLCQGAYSNLGEGQNYYERYRSEADAIYAKYKGSGGGGGGGHVEGYVNPLANARLRGERIDQGVDYAGTGYLTAIGECEILDATANAQPGWPGGFVEYRLTAPGPLGSHTVYYAEGIRPVVNAGDRLNPGDRICDLIPGWPTGIEIGWGANSSRRTWASVYGGGWSGAQDSADDATRAGISFSVLMGALGGPQGIVKGAIIGSWPEWTPGGNVPHLPQVGVGPGQPPVGPNPTTGVAHDYQWTINAEVAWSAAQVGALAGSHHAHAANFFARAYKYLIAPKQEAHG